jgi:hypothetical protein
MGSRIRGNDNVIAVKCQKNPRGVDNQLKQLPYIRILRILLQNIRQQTINHT